MSEETVNISYRIKLDDTTTEVFNFELDGDNFDLLNGDDPDPPDWAKLEFKQCSHCPLSSEEHSYCPVAVQIHNVVKRFHKTRSIDEVELEVITEERRVVQTTQIQRAIASMLGLVFPTCGCPKTAYMRPMARFHLPLASEEETVFHVSGMYLLSQFFVGQKNNKDPFEGLANLYDDMHILNKAVASRVQTATNSDSLKNAITLLDMYSTLIPMLIEDELVEMRRFFAAYLPKDEEGKLVEDTSNNAVNNYLERAKAFTLELVPIEEEKNDDTPDWLKEAKEEGGTKAVFKLPDDDPLPGKDTAAKAAGKASFALPEDDPDNTPSLKATPGKVSFKIDDRAPDIDTPDKPGLAIADVESETESTLTATPGKASFQIDDTDPQEKTAKPKGKASFALPDESTEKAENPDEKNKKDDDTFGGLKIVDFDP